MIKITKQTETKYLSFQDLRPGEWYLVDENEIVNYDGYSHSKERHILISFEQGSLIPLILSYPSSCSLRFTPIQVKGLEIKID